MIPKFLLKTINSLPQSSGVYIFKDQGGQVLYVGKSVHLRDRVKSYFLRGNMLGPKTAKMVAFIKSIEHINTETEIESLLLESDLIKKYQPYYNTQLKDDKSYKYIVIANYAFRQKYGLRKTVNRDLWPAIKTSRKVTDADALYFGPFPEGQVITRVLKLLRRIFPWCSYTSLAQRKRAKKACFYLHLNRCPGICDEKISLADYWRIIDQLVLFLQGEKNQIIKQQKRLMEQASRAKQYELAAYFRDLVDNLNYVTQTFHLGHDYVENPNLKQDLRAAELTDLLYMINLNTTTPLPAFRIECYDISNLGRTFTVAAGVAFTGGEKDTANYRRYKIKRTDLPNDFAALQETLKRRIKRGDLPDLFLIDGGKGQLAAVTEVFQANNVQIPAIGLAKRFETLVTNENGEFSEFLLPNDAPARKLLQRIRDEAHRFAQVYHHLLRAKSLRKS